MKKYLLSIRKYIALEIVLDLISSVALAFLPYLIKLLFDSANHMSLRQNGIFSRLLPDTGTRSLSPEM